MTDEDPFVDEKSQVPETADAHSSQQYILRKIDTEDEGLGAN